MLPLIVAMVLTFLFIYINVSADPSVTVTAKGNDGTNVMNNSIIISDTLSFYVNQSEERLIRKNIVCYMDGNALENCNSIQKEINPGYHQFKLKISDPVVNKNSFMYLNICKESFPVKYNITNQTNSPTVILELKPICEARSLDYKYTVDWGDGTKQTMNNKSTSHQYKTNGNFTINLIADATYFKGKKGNSTTTFPIKFKPYEFFTYSNDTFGVKLKYPVNFVKIENGTETDNITQIATFLRPYQNVDDKYQEQYETGFERINEGLDLDKYMAKLLEVYPSNLENFTMIESTTTNATLSGQPAYKLVYTFDNTEFNVTTKEMEMGTITRTSDGDALIYYIIYSSEVKEFDRNLPKAMELINSYEILPLAERTYTYKGPQHEIQIKYPPIFEKVDGDLDNNTDVIEIVTFDRLQESRNTSEEYYGIGLNLIRNQPNLQEYLVETIKDYEYFDGYKTLENTTNATLSGQPAYKLVYSYNKENGTKIKALEIGIIYEGMVYFIEYSAETTQYEKNISQILSYINTFRIV